MQAIIVYQVPVKFLGAISDSLKGTANLDINSDTLIKLHHREKDTQKRPGVVD